MSWNPKNGKTPQGWGSSAAPGDAKKRLQALGRLKQGQMNQTEKRYAERLDALLQAGEILWWLFEPMKLHLGERCYYSVDFLVLNSASELEAHEVKGGFIMDDAMVKIKTAAEKFPFKFIMAKWVKSKWEFKEY